MVPVFDGTKGDRRYSADKRRPSLASAPAASDGERNEKQEFRRILDEVQKLGASQLNWKERKEYEAKKLAGLGAKPTKSFKMPISMGMSIKRKREKTEADKLEHDILAGFLPKKSKKTPFRDYTDGKGLRVAEGKFKGGVLYVQKPESKPKDEKHRGKDRSLDRVFKEGGAKGGGKSKKGKGKKGGKKKGGKRKH